MVLFDIPYAFLAGGLIGWRGEGRRRDLALCYGAFGVAIPGLLFLERYPDWDWQYLLDPAALPAGSGALFVFLVLAAAWAGHLAGHRRPRALYVVALLLGLHLLLSAPRALHVGTLASWQAGGGLRLPIGFLLFGIVLMGGSVLLFAACWHLAGLATPLRLSSRERRVIAGLARATLPGVPEPDEDELGERVERLAGRFAWDGKSAFRLTLALFEWLALVRHGRPFSRLPPERQAARLAAWAGSPLAPPRLAARLLLTVIKPCLLARADVQQALGLPVAERVAPPPPRPAPRGVIERLDADRVVRCQVAVIGSGAGGAVVAAELAERGVDVVLLEEGRLFDPSRMERDPLDNLSAMYRDGGTTIALGRPPIPLPLGVTVGGTTTINSGTCLRAPAHVLQRWSELGLGLDPTELARAYERVEQRLSVRAVPEELLGGSSVVVRRGAQALGLSGRPLPRNVVDCRQGALCPFGCPHGAKQSADRTYVPAALAAGAVLYTGVRAEKLLVRAGRAAGVIARAPGGRSIVVHAERVVSACGAVAGVPFLARCGVKSRHLGRHLTVHPAAKVVALMPDPVEGWRDTPQGYLIDQHLEQGLLFEGAWVPPEYAAVAFPFVGAPFAEVMRAFDRLAMFGLMVADEPNGRVRTGLDGRPHVSYCIGERDLRQVYRGLELLAELFFAAGAERIYLPLAGRETQRSLDAARTALAGRPSRWGLELTAFHPLGTARMAARARDGVVDPALQSWELPGLYVVDGGVIPNSPGVNPMLSIMALATLAAERMAAS